MSSQSAIPLISCILATRNVAGVLTHLLESCAGQAWRGFELIVQDCGSTDGTLEVIERFAERIPHISIASEPDTGIYDAWNKALPRARGEWVLFVGADDFFLPNALQNIAPFLQGQPESIDYVAAPAAIANSLGRLCDTILPSPDPIQALKASLCFPHQGLFHRRRLFEANQFDTSLRIAGDYDFVCKTLTNSNYTLFPTPVMAMRLGGISTNAAFAYTQHKECARVARRYYGKLPAPMLVLRFANSLFVLGLQQIGGQEFSRRFADCIRFARGKTPLWSQAFSRHFTMAPLPEKPFISLLVATVNRKEPLLRLLRSLEAQAYGNVEVLIADQNPPDFLDEALLPFREKLRLQHVPVPNDGVSQARNALIPLAKGDIIAFPDDDCWYQPQTLRRICDIFASQPHLHGIVAAWSEEKPKKRKHALKLPVLCKYTSFKRGETYTQFYRKEAVEGIMFDPELGPGTGLPYGCGEDTDLLLQVLKRGSVIGRTPEVLVHHNRPDLSDPRLPQKARSYALGRMHLLRKHQFPLWFKLANIVYPLARLPIEGRKAWPYRKAMFLSRLQSFFHKH